MAPGAKRGFRERVVLLAVVAPLCLIGCNGDNDDGGAPAATPTSTSAAQPSATSTPMPTMSMAPSPTPSVAPSASPSATATTVASAALSGRVTNDSGQGLGGVMVTAHDYARALNVTVFTDAEGRYRFPALDGASYRLRARRIGFEEEFRDDVAARAGVDFTLRPATDLNRQLPASYFYSLLHWPSERIKGDFSRACANCHQIGDWRFQVRRSEQEWQDIINRMIGYGGVPFFAETGPLLLPTLAGVFGLSSPEPSFAVPSPPTGDAVRAVIYEWELDPERKPDCHDLELDENGVVYTVGGMFTLDPATAERNYYPVRGGGHSVERDANGDMWITAPGPEEMIKFDVRSKETTHFRQPRIGDDLGSYPHTLRFDDQGRIWYTLSRSNHVCRFDPPTGEFTYYRLPEADPADSGVPIPVPYGCDVAPDQTVWWSQLFGHKIGRVDPNTGEVTAWRTPFDGPRRLGVGPDNIVWVPFYGAAKLGAFDPRTETWKVYSLPTQPAGSELPYNLNVSWTTGDVWITGSNSDTLIRFRPSTEEFTIFPLPTPVNFTREFEFDDEGNVWTCTSDAPSYPGTEGTGRVIKLQLLEREGACGDGMLQLGEECDDGNTASCDGCSAACRVETGCGDGATCGDEHCDDGNRDSCDGCSATCTIETGFTCGDGIVNAGCGEQCDPPGPTCTRDCRRVPVCGDGFRDGEEECDDGNTVSCDGCSAACRVETGCGDGAACGEEQCDDGNLIDCDGCSAACEIEVGFSCGDGIVNEACGEECDPPAAECSITCRMGNEPLGTRHLSFGGSFYSSPLGTEVPLGTLHGAFDIAAGALDDDGKAPLSVSGPVYYSAAILGGTFGTLCVHIEACEGFIDCDGGSAVGVEVVQDSVAPGVQNQPVVTTTGLGEDGGRGAIELRCQQAFVQLAPGAGDDCAAAQYPPLELVVYTTGTASGRFLNAQPRVGNAMISLTGENFDCTTWTVENGPGQLAGAYLQEENSQAGDVANVNLIDD